MSHSNYMLALKRGRGRGRGKEKERNTVKLRFSGNISFEKSYSVYCYDCSMEGYKESKKKLFKK
jgi:hypothetical protein